VKEETSSEIIAETYQALQKKNIFKHRIYKQKPRARTEQRQDCDDPVQHIISACSLL